METRRPLIVDVKRGSFADGPGIRTVVFFKGCPLRCVFCHNPEARETSPEIAFTAASCIHCDRCVAACPKNAIDLSSARRINRNECDFCGRCAATCPTGATRLIGRYWPVEELLELLLRDEAFYRHSGGGVTLSGGEATLFPEYVHELLIRLRTERIHIALETCGYFDYPVFSERLLPLLDFVFFDVKLVDDQASRRYLGKSSTLIFENLQRLLADHPAKVHPRIPLIPEVTDSRQNLAAIVDLLSEWGASQILLLPYNPLGVSMYAALGRPTPNLPSSFTDPEREAATVAMFRDVISSRRVKPIPEDDDRAIEDRSHNVSAISITDGSNAAPHNAAR